MQRATRILVIAAVTLAFAIPAALATDAPQGKPQTTCPVTGEKIDKNVHVDYQGQRVYFCCEKCPPEFRKDPEKHFAKFEQDGVKLENIQTTCPVSGEKLGEGDMGEPVTVAYKGRNVKLCCNGCVKKFKAEPAKYLAMLPGEQPKPAAHK